MNDAIDTNNLICDFGPYNGQRWTRIPAQYLKKIANTGGHKGEKLALAELKRRGTITAGVEVSGHAVDRASQVLIGKWMELRTGNEGIHAWLCRMAFEARERGKKVEDKYHFAGMKFVFAEGALYPVLTTVMADN
jgi:hypothetical protein